MNFQFDEDQDALRSAARKLLTSKATLEAFHKHMDQGSDYDRELWALMAENGYQGIGIPEAYGGAGMGYINQVVVADELGYVLAHTPYTSSIVGAAEAIMLAGSEAQKQKYLPKLASGEWIGTFAYCEQNGRYDAEGVTAQASGGKISGTKMPVTDAACANFAVVAARGAAGVSLYLVDLKQSGVTIEPLRSMELTRKQAAVKFNGATAELPGGEGQGAQLLDALYDRMAILVAFEQLGGAQRCVEMARDYSLERYIFGRPLAMYQGIKHRISDMHAKIELARSNCLYGAWALDSSPADIAEAAALARSTLCDAYEFAAQENLQVHGGIGFTWEGNCHMFVKRMRHLEALLGGRILWREKLLKALERKVA